MKVFIYLFSALCIIGLHSAASANNKEQIPYDLVLTKKKATNNNSAQWNLQFINKSGSCHFYTQGVNEITPSPVISAYANNKITISWPQGKRMVDVVGHTKYISSIIYGSFTAPLTYTPDKTIKGPVDLFKIFWHACCEEQCYTFKSIFSGDRDKISVQTTNFNPAIDKIAHNPKLAEPAANYKSLPSAVKNKTSITRLWAISFFIGVLINILPCVLPVLGIKLSSFLHYSNNKLQAKVSALGSIVGILLFFVITGLLTISAKSLVSTLCANCDQEVWGTMFQSYKFIIALQIFLFIILELHIGVVNIHLPTFIIKKSQGYLAKFFFNVFNSLIATIIAMPCVASIISPIIIATLLIGKTYTFISFFLMGVGMSLPYILAVIFPGIISKLPKSGRWQHLFNDVISGLIIISIIWLGLVLSKQLGIISLAILFLMLIISNIMKKGITKKRKYSFLALLIIIIVTVFYLSRPEANKDKYQWKPFSLKKIDKALDRGEIVLVNFTAEWCILCKINQFFVFDTKEFNDLVRENKNLILMRADLTTQNNEAALFMKDNNIMGLPYTALYSENYPLGKVFKPLLNKKDFIRQLDKEVKSR